MKIIKLAAENIKRIKAIEITPNSNLIVIGGRNAQGKSSVLDSIEYALAGVTSFPEKPIRIGENKARIVCELDDLIVTRKFSENTDSLVITNKKGLRFPSPQAVLDKLVGKLGFDPLDFIRMNTKDQQSTLRKLVGLDFAETDANRQTLYDERTIINREIKRLENKVDSMTEYPDTPDSEISISELMIELKQREALNRENKTKRDYAANVHTQVEAQKVVVSRLEVELKQAQSRLENLCRVENESQLIISALEDVDEEEVKKEILNAETTNRKVQSNKGRASTMNELEEKKLTTVGLTKQIEEIEELKKTALAGAQFPIEGISFEENSVSYLGIPLNQCSLSEQLKVSVAIGIAMNPRIKVILIRDGSLLDRENLRSIAEMAKEMDTQIWIERVGEDEEVSVIIEDGMIKCENEEIPL